MSDVTVTPKPYVPIYDEAGIPTEAEARRQAYATHRLVYGSLVVFWAIVILGAILVGLTQIGGPWMKVT